MDWVGAQWGGFQAEGTICDWVVDPVDMADLFTDPTLMVSRCVYTFRQGATAPGISIGAVGFGLIEWQSTANELPIICPDVFIDSDLDWILRQVFPVPAGSPGGTIWNVVLDDQFTSAAKRRLETGASILMCSTIIDVPSGNFSADIRCLIKE
jgi:hypothetical protein